MKKHRTMNPQEYKRHNDAIARRITNHFKHAPVRNWNCDGAHCRNASGEVRVYPLGSGGNLILCSACFAHENRYRAERGKESGRATDWPLVNWNAAEIYSTDSR